MISGMEAILHQYWYKTQRPVSLLKDQTGFDLEVSLSLVLRVEQSKQQNQLSPGDQPG